MPALLSHHIFGRSLLPKLDADFRLTRDQRDAFLLGNQGPDPLFYATFSTRLVRIKTLGSRMHNEHIEDYLALWRQQIQSASGQRQALLSAYLNGFLCHFALDSTAHPFVLAFTEAIAHVGIAGLNVEDSSYIHGQLEADLDVYLLYRMTGRTINEYYIPKQLLYSSPAALRLIDTLYTSADQQLYRLGVPSKVFSLAVRDMRRTVRLSYSPGGTKRRLLGKIERLARQHSLLQAMSHRKDGHLDCWFANEQHQTWLHPQSRRPQSQSYCELFDHAQRLAAGYIKLFWQGADPATITGGRDFLGCEKGEGAQGEAHSRGEVHGERAQGEGQGEGAQDAGEAQGKGTG